MLSVKIVLAIGFHVSNQPEDFGFEDGNVVDDDGPENIFSKTIVTMNQQVTGIDNSSSGCNRDIGFNDLII